MDQSEYRGSSRAAHLLAAFVRGYQLVFAGTIPHCRFVPSCSDFMRESLLCCGVVAGLPRGIARILKCHPWHPGGFDPVRYSSSTGPAARNSPRSPVPFRRGLQRLTHRCRPTAGPVPPLKSDG